MKVLSNYKIFNIKIFAKEIAFTNQMLMNESNFIALNIIYTVNYFQK